MADKTRARWGWALVLMGGVPALWFGALLGFFLLSDGRTLLGASYRADPEFQRSWLVNVPVLVLALRAMRAGNRLRRAS